MNYRKKPVVIQATQWFKDGDHPAVSRKTAPDRHADEGIPWVPTLEGGHVVTPGDWIITGVKGEHYPCKPDIFEMTYEPDAALDTAQPEPAKFINCQYGENGYACCEGRPCQADIHNDAIEQQAQPERAPSDFDVRGFLASRLKCWHRLTEIEADELVALVKLQSEKPLSDQQIHERYKLIRGDSAPRYIEIYRDAERAHGIKQGGHQCSD